MLAVVLWVLAPCAVWGGQKWAGPAVPDRDYVIDRWEAEQGLPESSATAIVQTPDGYLWFGTFDGLVRFDGVSFTVFDRGNTPALPSAGIVSLFADRAGRLWVGTLGGVAMLDGSKWRSFGDKDGWAGDYPRTFSERSDGTVLVTTFNGHFLEFSQGRFHELPSPPGVAERGYMGAVDGAGRWWVVQHGFIGWWNGSGWTRGFEPPPLLPDDVGAAASRDGGLWLLLRQDLVKIRDGVEVSRVRLAERPGGIWSLCEDSRGNIWACTYESGLCRISQDGEFRRWGIASGLSTDYTRSILEDREGSLWVGTSGAGLARFKTRRVRAPGAEEGLANRVVSSVSTDSRGGVLIAAYGAGMFAAQGDSVAPMPLPEVKASQVRLHSILTDRAGRVWIGTAETGLLLREGSESRWIPDGDTAGRDIISLFEDSRGRVWMSSGTGIAVCEGGKFRVYGTDAGVASAAYFAFAEDADGAIWAANGGSVHRLEQGRFVEVLDLQGKSIQQVRCLKALPDRTMWMGLYKGGLLRWRLGRLDRVNAALPVRSIFGILADETGTWWMPTDRGILRASQPDLDAAADGTSQPLNFQLLGVADGMANTDCDTGAQPVCARDTGGKLWFATRNGVAVIDPADFRVNLLPPTVMIEQLSYMPRGGRTGEAGPGSRSAGARTVRCSPFSEVVQLPAGSRRLEIRYTALSLASAESVRFQTKLEGQDEDWQDAARRRDIQYYELQPGEYRFRVRAANNDGIWNLTGASLAFTIAPLAWQTTWFRVGAAIVLISVGGGVSWRLSVVRYRRRRSADEQFRLAIEAATSAMVMVDSRGAIVLVNAQMERYFGYSRQEMIGQQIEMLLPERFVVHHAEFRHSYAANPTPRPMGAGRELFGRRKDGSEFPLEIGLNPIRTTERPLVLASIIDISERKRIELEIARQRNEVFHLSRVNMLSELSGSLAHELNQPLTAILSNAQAAQRFMARDPIDLGEVREILGDIVAQDKRAGEVIHRLRQLLKKGQVEPTELHIGEVIQDVLKLVHSDLINHGVSVRAELDDGLPRVRGDRVHIQQVLINLVINGCDAMAGNPSVARKLVVTAQADGARGVRVAVSDSGTGIAAEHMDQVFQPFFTTKSTGMGLGLVVCRTIIGAHGGELRAANNPGRGATFSFTLPALSDARE